MPIRPEETVVRLLFSDQMVSDEAVLTVEAFPADELTEKGGKSVSVDRIGLFEKYWLKCKLITYENPRAGRKKWGWCEAAIEDVISIRSQDNQQLFVVHEDKITNFPPNPWDHAHAKIVRAKPEFTKALLRGYRDKLIDVFKNRIEKEF